MPENEEISEHVHHAQEPFDKLVAGTMAIVAALLAIVTVLGQHFNTEKLLLQQKASDQWAFYQAKDIRRYAAQLGSDVLSQLKADGKLVGKYSEDTQRYKKQTAEIQQNALDFEKERDGLGKEADFYHFGEVFLEVAIVFSSLSILTKRKQLFVGGMISAVVGLAIAIYGAIMVGFNAHV